MRWRVARCSAATPIIRCLLLAIAPLLDIAHSIGSNYPYASHELLLPALCRELQNVELAAEWGPPGGPQPAPPHSFRVALAPRLLVTGPQSMHFVPLACALEAAGWRVWDIDAVIQTGDIRGDISRAIGHSGAASSPSDTALPSKLLLVHPKA